MTECHETQKNVLKNRSFLGLIHRLRFFFFFFFFFSFFSGFLLGVSQFFNHILSSHHHFFPFIPSVPIRLIISRPIPEHASLLRSFPRLGFVSSSFSSSSDLPREHASSRFTFVSSSSSDLSQARLFFSIKMSSQLS